MSITCGFDTPPILGLADAAIASTQTDGVIMVARSGQTPKEAAVQAKKILESVNAKVLGVVLNAINESPPEIRILFLLSVLLPELYEH